MGKIAVSESKPVRHNPLWKDISLAGGNLRSRALAVAADADDEFLDATSTRRILRLAKMQQEEMEEQQEEMEEAEPDAGPSPADARPSFADAVDDDSESSEYSEFEVEEYEVGEAEADYGDVFGGELVNLADKILAKIHEKELAQQPQEPQGVKLPEKVILAYEKVGQILATYKHGKLPKLFKVLPSLRNWEDVVYVTNPEAWTPHATYEATKLFASNLKANDAQRFMENVLLPKFRDLIDLSEEKLLNYHIYRALKKALYKPGAFFKGFLLPLADAHCSVREAVIVASVLGKVSIPVLHLSVALTHLLKKDFSPATTVFIRVLIEKKYALPYQTLDELVFYFMRFRGAEHELPVVWHKAFLAFAQRYKNDITADQRDFLLETVRQKFHHAMGPEIRRELLAGTSDA